MAAKFELERFPDKRLKLLVRFMETTNFWFNDEGEATWVPTLEEVEQLYETLAMTNSYNINNRRLRRASTGNIFGDTEIDPFSKN